MAEFGVANRKNRYEIHELGVIFEDFSCIYTFCASRERKGRAEEMLQIRSIKE